MKMHTGPEIRQIMDEMPNELVEALRAAYPEHAITEREARYWGYLQMARTDSYEGTSFAFTVNGTGEQVVYDFLSITLSWRQASARAGLG